VKIVRRDRAWWIDDAPPFEADGAVQTTYGPYRTEEEAADDLEGLERFFEENPAYESFIIRAESAERGRASHWLSKSVHRLPGGLTGPRHRSSSPGQKSLPGMEEPDSVDAE
jgi:hypothetical protein